jgi:hypothetical protein
MSGRIVTALTAAILFGSTALAAAQTREFPQDRAYVDGYGWSFGATGFAYDPYYRVVPAPYAYGYYDYAPGYYGYAPGYYGSNRWDW